MKNKLKILIGFCFLCLIVLSCKPSRKSISEKIDKLEKNIYSKTSVRTVDTIKVNELLKLYKDYSKYYTSDSLAPGYLLRAANLSMNMNRPVEAIEFINRIITKYPESKLAAEGLFIKAFIYDNLLKDYTNAKKYYEEFIQKYPTHAFVNDARNSIKFLGKSPEEILKELENKQDSLQ